MRPGKCFSHTFILSSKVASSTFLKFCCLRTESLERKEIKRDQNQNQHNNSPLTTLQSFKFILLWITFFVTKNCLANSSVIVFWRMRVVPLQVSDSWKSNRFKPAVLFLLFIICVYPLFWLKGENSNAIKINLIELQSLMSSFLWSTSFNIQGHQGLDLCFFFWATKLSPVIWGIEFSEEKPSHHALLSIASLTQARCIVMCLGQWNAMSTKPMMVAQGKFWKNNYNLRSPRDSQNCIFHRCNSIKYNVRVQSSWKICLKEMTTDSDFDPSFVKDHPVQVQKWSIHF